MLGRWFSPDPINQLANPYIYCGNNPIMYVDPDGQLFWLIPVVVGIVAGAANVAANWDHIDGFWQGVSTFVTGGLAGAGACFTGGWSVMGMMGYGALAGGVMGFNNDIVAQTGQNFEGFGEINWGQVGKSAGYGALSGGVGAGVGKWAVNANWLGVNGINSPVLRSAATSVLAAGSAHVAVGTTAGLFEGQSLNQAFTGSFDGIGKSMVTSAIISSGTTAGVSAVQGINPLTGNIMYPRNNGFLGRPQDIQLQKGQMIDRYGGETGQYFSPEGTPIEQRALPPNANMNMYNRYEVRIPFDVKAGPAAPYFGQPGGGTQYFSTEQTAGQLVDGKYLKVIK